MCFFWQNIKQSDGGLLNNQKSRLFKTITPIGIIYGDVYSLILLQLNEFLYIARAKYKLEADCLVSEYPQFLFVLLHFSETTFE